jgi:uncharacterized membrane protein YbhN (UPF0104 family)
MAMPRWFPGFLSGHHIERGWRALGVLLCVASLLELAAALGLASIAGFSQVATVLGHFNWHWLLVLPAAWTVSYIGYYHAYRGVFRVRSGPAMRRRVVAAVALAGFGGFLAYRGGSLDGYALRMAGASEADAKIRVAALGGLEQGALALAGCGVAAAVLLARITGVSASATLTWALAPVPGLLIAFWLADHFATRLTGDRGWRSIMRTFFGSILMIRELFSHPLRWGPAIIGMTVFWLADAVAAWAGLAAFGLRMNAAALFIGFASGMVFSRRIGPLAGAGILALVLPLTISYCGAPLATAVAGVFAYRILSLWLQAPSWIAALPALRKISGHQDATRTALKPVVGPAVRSALRD